MRFQRQWRPGDFSGVGSALRWRVRNATDAGTMLQGHRAQMAEFAAAMASDRLHHAWLLAGPKGIGKRRFADQAARLLLGDSDAGRALLAAGSHPDMRVLTPPEGGRGSATGTLTVDQVRAERAFLNSHASMGGRRVLVIDSVDDMNMNAANALLKELEEPRQGTLFVAITHAPMRLLPTIRSRCRMLRFAALSDADTAAVIEAERPDLMVAARDALVRLARGAPGQVLSLEPSDLDGLEPALDAALADAGAAFTLASGLQGPSGAGRFDALARLVQQRLAAAARAGDRAAPDLHARAARLAGDTRRLALDRTLAALQLIAWARGRAGHEKGAR